MVVRLIATALFLIWLGLVLAGKGGFVHLLLLNALGVAAVEVMTVVRARLAV